MRPIHFNRWMFIFFRIFNGEKQKMKKIIVPMVIGSIFFVMFIPVLMVTKIFVTRRDFIGLGICGLTLICLTNGVIQSIKELSKQIRSNKEEK